MGNIFQRSNRSSPKFRTIVPNHTVTWADSPKKKSHPNHAYKSNIIETTKYNIITFLPKNMFEQFHRFANLYFLFVVGLNFIPEVQAFGKEIAMLPILFVLGVTGIKDAYEDFRRYKSDKKVNSTHCRIYSRRPFQRVEWKEVRVGDLIHLSCNEIIPADIVLLKSSDESGLCHVETSNLDGETNLKQRRCVPTVSFAADGPPTKDFKYNVHCELPNAAIYKFHGYVEADGRQIGMDQNHLLLRGCTIRNTDYVEGLVVYAGHDTKAMLNNRTPRYKRSKLERQINRDVIYCVILLLFLCLFCAVSSGIWLGTYTDNNKIIFIPFQDEDMYNPFYQGFIVFFTYIIIFQSVIPLPLYVSVEFVKLGQIFFINSDKELFHEPTNKRLECRALNITEDLGQIEYIFSDKTGTLTENVMEFKCCTIGGVDFPHTPELDEESDVGSRYSLAASSCTGSILENLKLEPLISRELSSATLRSVESVDFNPNTQSHRIREFFLLMALCNTVVVSNKPHEDVMDECGDAVEPKGQKPNTPDKFIERNQSLPDSLKKRSFLPPLASSLNRCHTPPRMNTISSLPMFPPESRPSELSLPTAAYKSEYPSCLTPSEGSIAASSIVSELAARTRYEAESPDELALVRAAASYGCCLVKRTSEKVIVWLPYMESQVDFEALEIIQFDSTRKRMSVIIRNPLSREIILFTKGADSAILSILDKKFKHEKHLKKLVRDTEQLIIHYAMQGLRTLCMGRKSLTEKEYEIWKQKYNHAKLSTENREQKVLEIICELESNLELLGATGIEDKLQEGVPETIANLRKAGIKVWVVTGDKQETAIEVAYASELFSQGQELITINGHDLEETKSLLQHHLGEIKKEERGASLGREPGSPPPKLDLALVIDGKTLTFALEESVEKYFLALCERCSSVVCCRATPIQKGMVVKLVRDCLKKLTLAIGDGANDVSMIQTADIGIGISGQEGMQAVMASDFAIARFMFLERLLLVHGHWSYDRLAKFTSIMFYKSMITVFILVWFQIFSGFSGATNIDSLYLMLMHLIFTSWPPIMNGVLDKDLAADTLLKFPKLYEIGPQDKVYTKFSFFVALADAIYQSFCIYFVSHYTIADSHVGIWEMGTNICTVLVLAILLTIAIETHTWVWLQWLLLVLSFVSFWMFAIIIDSVWIDFDHPVTPYWIMHNTIAQPIHMLIVLFSSVLALLPRFVIRTLQKTIFPDEICKAQMWEKLQEEGETDRKNSVISSSTSERSPQPDIYDHDVYSSQSSLVYNSVHYRHERNGRGNIDIKT
ncbi:hypothetical protein ScPMuIL_009818 [Solemya velum]